MKIVYTKHAEDKLRRKDIRRFGVTKRLIKRAIEKSTHISQTRYGAWAALLPLNGYTLRIIYAIIGEDKKIITFHIAKKGRYES